MYSKLVIMCLLGTLGLGTVTAQDPDQESSKSSTIIIKRVITGEDGKTREQTYRRVMRDGKIVEESGDPDLLDSMDVGEFGKGKKGGVIVRRKGLGGLDIQIPELKGLKGLIEFDDLDLEHLEGMIEKNGGKIAGRVLRRLKDLKGLKDFGLDMEFDVKGPIGLRGKILKDLEDLKVDVEVDTKELHGRLKDLLGDVDIDVRIPHIRLPKGLHERIQEEMEEEVEEIEEVEEQDPKDLEKQLRDLRRQMRRLQERLERLTEEGTAPRRLRRSRI